MPENVELPLRTPVSEHMYHAEVLGLAKAWLDRCKCVTERVLQRKDYPTRLINLAELKKRGTIDAKKWIYHEDLGMDELGNTTVNVVDTNDLDWSKLEDKAYVTLSHKWGGTDKPARLTKGTEKAYREGVRLGDLPRTFRDAIHFALRVDDRVHYIWIDSLCIIQGDEDDWLKESALMQDVYRNSFLNISATAAEQSGEGLYSHRDPQHLWEEVVRLDVDGLHQGEEKLRKKSRATTWPRYNGDANTTATTGPAPESKFTPLAKVQSCLLVDVSNWEALVNQAPVNKRGWVVQERLLAPRVLHFCRGRVAWECAEFDDIEGHVPGIPNYQLIADEIYEGVQIKGLEPGEHGRRLRNNRLRGVADSLDLGENDPESKIVHALELWSRIVEMYCKTDLTQQNDKLIALSGIAHRMADVIAESGQIRYVAGLWNVHLVSQLLWHVEPVYRGDSDSSSDTIEYLSRRPKEYRAPSFSWASVDAQFGNGIACGHVLDSDGVLVEIPQDKDDTWSRPETEDWKKSVSVQFETANEFGLVKSGHIRLWAWVHHVKLQKERTHYYWSLVVSNDSTTEPYINEKRENFNIYLDCPRDDDQNNKLIDSDGIYCIPIAYGSSSRSNDLICLLLEKAPDDPQVLKWPDEYRQRTFRRIGYTKLSATFDHFTWNRISHFRPSQKASDGFYDGRSGRHLVCII
ncbi:heterokaryon incompatibility protein-domain-containing protein [Diaporthe sp. PMI_573]|jgi:hypothetical protein|nr:heterokaryon incompatibility protein-domain-containing protein [Diaporthaceae sp. PMI_573]